MRVNLKLHGGIKKERPEHKHLVESLGNYGSTFALKSLDSNERKSMSLMSDRIKSLEENSKIVMLIAESCICRTTCKCPLTLNHALKLDLILHMMKTQY